MPGTLLISRKIKEKIKIRPLEKRNDQNHHRDRTARLFALTLIVEGTSEVVL
jgi:hypothetical protein